MPRKDTDDDDWLDEDNVENFELNDDSDGDGDSRVETDGEAIDPYEEEGESE